MENIKRDVNKTVKCFLWRFIHASELVIIAENKLYNPLTRFCIFNDVANTIFS